jgi:CheY-like chemotaxis protein
MSNSRGPVLVVDDDQDIRFVLADVLEAEDYQPFTAENGKHALEVLQHMPLPCVVLLDLMMPVMDGHAFLSEVRARPELCSQLHVVICTASTNLPSLAPPVEGILRKPFETDDLLEVLKQKPSA